jgi:hypothetical protein
LSIKYLKPEKCVFPNAHGVLYNQSIKNQRYSSKRVGVRRGGQRGSNLCIHIDTQNGLSHLFDLHLA